MFFFSYKLFVIFPEFTSSAIISVKEDTPVGTKVHSLETGAATSIFSLLYVSHPGINITGSGSVIVGESGLDYEMVDRILMIVEAVSTTKPM